MAQEFINGILEYCYNGIPIIRGYASYKTLIKLSSAHPAYQRIAEKTHVQELENFLKSPSSMKFMPEVILSYDCVGLWNNIEDWYDPGVSTPIEYLDSGAEYIAGSISIRDHTTGLKLQRIRGSVSNYKLIKLDVSDTTLISQKPIFRRIDGNHRLQALEQANIKDFKIPYCIVLLSSSGVEALNDREKVEMEIFHNINSKSKPLTPIEQYRGFLNLFNVDELLHYGEEYSLTKAYLDKYENLHFVNIADYLVDKEDIILHSIKFLLKKGFQVSEDDLADILNRLEHTYFYKYNKIQHCKSKDALIPYIYYCMEGGKKENAKLSAYNTWFIENKLFNIDSFDPISMVDIFNSIYEIRHKQIFVAMPFKKELNFVFDAICDTINKINNDYKLELPAPIRIDKQIIGFSYDIVDEILENIKNAGLLIADLTEQNANVYYEAGYALGLIKAKIGNTAKILYLISNPKEPENPFGDSKFDVQHYKMISYKNDGNGVSELKANLEKELLAFYCIDRKEYSTV